MDFVRYLYHHEQQIKLGFRLEVLCFFPDQPAAGVFDTGAVQQYGLGVVRILLVLVYLDAPLLPDGLCRLLHEKGQVVGISDPAADDLADGHVLYELFFGLSVFVPAVYPDHTVLCGGDDIVSRVYLPR